VPDYGNYCPVALGTEVLADRWTPLIVRELLLGNTRFNDIARGLPGISRSLLTQRLKHLERKGVIEHWPAPSGRGGDYRLTPAGEGLLDVVTAMGEWAVTWLYHEMRYDDIDAVTLMWWMHRRVDRAELPQERVVLQFDHLAPERVTSWIVLERGEASVCVQHPGFEVDAVIAGTTPAIGRVFNGFTTWSRAIAAGDLAVDGPRPIVRALPRWFLGSPFGDVNRARAAKADS
jgi:DNA-binding HxlR family transcriptional regulator